MDRTNASWSWGDVKPRALGPFRQAVLDLRWFRERACVHCLARDAGISQATAYRYLHEGIDALADQAPDLHDVLNRRRRDGMTHVTLDGTLIASDRLAGVRDNGNDLWFSQKHKAFGGNVQFLSSPDGSPLWVSDIEPGSTPDITASAHPRTTRSLQDRHLSVLSRCGESQRFWRTTWRSPGEAGQPVVPPR